MNWFKLLRHDARCGLLRWRYFVTLFLFAIPCFVFARILHQVGIQGSWMDYMLYLFQGKEPIVKTSTADRVDLPMLWLLVTSGCLFINLDYLLKDLTNAGQQIIIRSKSRTLWYLSKCIWNLGSCLIYFAAAGITCALFAWATGAQLSAQNTTELSFMLFGFAISEPLTLAPAYAVLASWVIPFLTMLALSMLQMTLCLYVKPIISFVICNSQLVLSLYLNSAFVLGNGAMTIRSGFASENGISPTASTVLAIVVMIASVVAGCLRFRRTDILSLEE